MSIAQSRLARFREQRAQGGTAAELHDGFQQLQRELQETVKDLLAIPQQDVWRRVMRDRITAADSNTVLQKMLSIVDIKQVAKDLFGDEALEALSDDRDVSDRLVNEFRAAKRQLKNQLAERLRTRDVHISDAEWGRLHVLWRTDWDDLKLLDATVAKAPAFVPATAARAWALALHQEDLWVARELRGEDPQLQELLSELESLAGDGVVGYRIRKQRQRIRTHVRELKHSVSTKMTWLRRQVRANSICEKQEEASRLLELDRKVERMTREFLREAS